MKSINHFYNKTKKKIYRKLCTNTLKQEAGRTILLTFDDGPHPEVTPGILDLLKHFNAKAIFFIIGNRIRRAPKLLSRILEEGHKLGNHTYTHPIDRKIGFREYIKELKKCEELIEYHTGRGTLFHRPPGGQNTAASLLAPKLFGLSNIFWSISSKDWCRRFDTEAVLCAEEMIQHVRPCDILLFHDRWLHTILTLEILLPELREQGYGFEVNIDHIVKI